MSSMPEPTPASILGSPRVVATSLALVAGYVDGYALRLFGTYVSFMSGNTTFAGTQIGQANLRAAVPAMLAIAGFLGGSFAGNWFTSSKIYSSRSILLTLAALLLGLVILVSFHQPAKPNTAIPLLSFAMGLINPSLPRIGGEPVSLTFVTGTLNRIGGDLAQAAHQIVPANQQGPSDTHLRRALLEAGVWASFFTGAILSAAAARFGVLQLLPAMLVLGLFALSASSSKEGS